jgi:recombination protein RecT
MTTTTTPVAARPKDDRRLTLRKLFDQQKPELAKLLPRGMDPERLFRMALTECVKNEKLLQCTAESWALAMQVCASQGLYPDSGLGYMYLIPRNNSKKLADGTWVKRMEVTAQRGYQGDLALARKTGEIADIYAEVVYEKDEYKVTKGLDRNIVHVPYEGDDDPGALRATYAVAKLRSGETAFVTLTKRDVMRHKLSSFETEKDDSPWKKHEAAMWKKTAIHELFKWLPKSSEDMERVSRAIAAENRPAIETTAIDLGKVEVALSGDDRPALDQVTDQLAGSQAQDCDHPGVPKNIPPGQTVACEKCGEVFEGEPAEQAAPATAERVVGEDDDQPTPRAAVEAIAGKAAAEKGRPKQGRLSE